MTRLHARHAVLVLVAAAAAAAAVVAVLMLQSPPRTPEGLVTGYLQQHGSHLGDGSSVRRVTAEDVPPDTIFVLAQLSGAPHDSVACLVRAEQVYCSTAPQAFAEFMRDYRYFEDGGLNDQQLWRVYRTLGVVSGLEYIKFTDIRLERTGAGLVIAFGVTQEPGGDPLPVTLTLSRDYQLQEGR